MTHYSPLDLVLNVNFGNRWNVMMFQDHSLILLCSQYTQIVIICTQMKLSELGSALRYSFATPLSSFWVEFNYPTNLGVALPDVEY